MNERIRLLAEQAGAIFVEENGDLLGVIAMPDESIQTMEKFAELIVRECIDTAFHQGHPDLEFLLTHFGIKQ